ncbi:MAG: NAD(+) synthase [Coriobacteriales bacterium]|nr:NAD(+) synthase [Coriobacteriales bacterium]
MKIALAQIGSIPGDFSQTVDHMLETAYQAKRRGADLIVFPATVFCGAYPQGLAESSAFMLDMLDALASFSENTPLLAAVPAYINDDYMCYTEIFMCAKGICCPVRARNARRPGLEDTPPVAIDAVWTIDGLDIGFVTSDAQFLPQREDHDVDIYITPISFNAHDPATFGVAGFAESPFADMIAESDCWFAIMQGVGAYDEMIIPGGSFAVDPLGIIACSCLMFEEDLAFFDVVPKDEEPPHIEPRPGTYVGYPADEVQKLPDSELTGLLYKALVLSIRDYVHKSGFHDVLVGLSGGIDSAVVATMATDALGFEHVTGVLMPGPYSSEGSVTDACELARALGIKTIKVPITDMHSAVKQGIADCAQTPVAGLANENLQARLRGTILMTLSNMYNCLVLNTGNKSESAMGYSTLYGDTVGAFSPMCDIYKHDVYKLAQWRNTRGGVAPIPQSTLTKPPSAELSSGQTDEASLGYPYDLIDKVLEMHIEQNMSAQEIAREGMDPKAVEYILNTCKNNEYKRRQEPMGPIVSQMPLVERGWPVVLGWKDRVHPTDPADEKVTEWLSESLGFDADEDFLEEFEASPVAVVLDAMIARSSGQDQIIGMLSDLGFSAQMTGQGPQMDGYMGFPIFSKN